MHGEGIAAAPKHQSLLLGTAPDTGVDWRRRKGGMQTDNEYAAGADAGRFDLGEKPA